MTDLRHPSSLHSKPSAPFRTKRLERARAIKEFRRREVQRLSAKHARFLARIGGGV